jgi:membrane-associated protease RseP (regulator of RpoE activity)
MPDSPPSSNDSLGHSATPSAEDAPRVKTNWSLHIGLFLATVASMFIVSYKGEAGTVHDRVVHGAQFAGTLTAILLAHEFGHYFAARIHKVEASLPFFIPLPIPEFSLLGTMGAVIRMRGKIKTRNALLDIGASGPLAGLCVAIPAYLWGAAHSGLAPLSSGQGLELGDSLALKVMDHFAGGNIPPGMELSLSPVAFAAWGGMLVTMINLFPVTQLDGGHVAYALLGPRQDRVAVTVHRSMLVFFFVSVAAYTVRDLHAGIGFYRMGNHIQNSLFWLLWFHVLAVIGTATATDEAVEQSRVMSIRVRIAGLIALLGMVWVGSEKASSPIYWLGWFAALGMFIALDVRGGMFKKHTLLDHPATGGEPLNLTRRIVAIITLAWFVLLFMPAPITI